MYKINSILVFLAEWLLYIFPLYQGIMELYEEEDALEQLIPNLNKTEKISYLYWLFPPLKIYLERKRFLKVIKKSVLEGKNIHAILTFYNKASAWFFVSIAGLIKSFDATHKVYEIFLHKQPIYIFYITFTILWTVFSSYIFYRVRKNSKIEKIIYRKNDIEKIDIINKIVK